VTDKTSHHNNVEPSPCNGSSHFGRVLKTEPAHNVKNVA
jgi:hypothetical protein